MKSVIDTTNLTFIGANVKDGWLTTIIRNEADGVYSVFTCWNEDTYTKAMIDVEFIVLGADFGDLNDMQRTERLMKADSVKITVPNMALPVHNSEAIH